MQRQGGPKVTEKRPLVISQESSAWTADRPGAAKIHRTALLRILTTSINLLYDSYWSLAANHSHS